MFDPDIFKMFSNENYHGMRKYLVEEIDKIIDQYLPEYSLCPIPDISRLSDDLTGVMLTYQLTLEDESSPKGLVIHRLFYCYNAFCEKFGLNK